MLPLPPKRAADEGAEQADEGPALPAGERRVLLGDRANDLWGDLEDGFGGLGGIGLGHIGGDASVAPPPPRPPPPPKPVPFVRAEDIRACPAVVPKKP